MCRQQAAVRRVDATRTAVERPSAVTVSPARGKSATNRKCSVSELGLFSFRHATLFQRDMCYGPAVSVCIFVHMSESRYLYRNG